MNKQLAKQGSTLNKNMSNTESLNLTDATIDICTSNLVKANALDLPIVLL